MWLCQLQALCCSFYCVSSLFSWLQLLQILEVMQCMKLENYLGGHSPCGPYAVSTLIA